MGRVLNPDVLRPRLTRAAIFIIAFEMLKATIVDRIRNFFSVGFDAEGAHLSPEYADVLARNRSPVHASLDWLVEQGDSLNATQKKLVADTCSYVSANPLKSVGIAVLVGFLLSRITL